jgi:hypothetical protein
MPIETPAGTLEVENAKFRASSVEATIAVGIGTDSNDAYPLQVFKETAPSIRLSEGSTISSAARFYSNNSNLYIQTGTDFSSGSSGDVAFQTMGGQSTHMVIKSDGNVGVGTTSPIAALDIDAGANDTTTPALAIRGGYYDTSDLYVLNTYNTNTGVGYAAKVIGVNIKNKVETDNTVQIRNNVGGLDTAGAIYLGSDDLNQGIFGVLGGVGATGTTLSEHLTVRAGGNVGIGTAGPQNKFSIRGDSVAVTTDPSVANYGQLEISSSSYAGWTNADRPTKLKMGIDHSVGGLGSAFIQGVVDYVNAGVPLLLCPGGGNVGIGTTNPSAKLHVNGTTRGVPGVYASGSWTSGTGIELGTLDNTSYNYHRIIVRFYATNSVFQRYNARIRVRLDGQSGFNTSGYESWGTIIKKTNPSALDYIYTGADGPLFAYFSDTQSTNNSDVLLIMDIANVVNGRAQLQFSSSYTFGGVGYTRGFGGLHITNNSASINKVKLYLEQYSSGNTATGSVGDYVIIGYG